MNYLLDTNVLSEPLRPHPNKSVIDWLQGVDEDRLFISVIQIAELSRGVALLPEGRKQDRLKAWLQGDLQDRFEGRLLDLDRKSAALWGELMAKAQKEGWALSPLDAFLAAIALTHAFILVSRNEKDFVRTGVTLLNPWALAP